MKRSLQFFSFSLFLGMIAFSSTWAQCVELGGSVGELSPVLKEVGGFCGDAAVATDVCDCPTGFVAVGYEGLEGNFWGPEVLSQFSLRCRQLNQDGTLGAAVSVTCSNGTDVGDMSDGPIDATSGEALVGFEVRIGCAMDAVMGSSKPIGDIAAGSSNATSNPMAPIGGSGGSPAPIMFVPDGNVIVGMQSYVDPNSSIVSGVAWRYAPIASISCANCSIDAIAISNESACNDNGTDAISSDDTFTADITVTFTEAPESGTLDLERVDRSVPVGNLVDGSHTFTAVTLPANGANINITASFSDAACRASANLGRAPENCSPNAPAPGNIPTLSEWGLILFALIIFTLSVVFGVEQKEFIALATGSSTSSNNRTRFPFNSKVYFAILPIIYLMFVLVFAVAILVFGYELTVADLPGTLLSGAIVAYLIHFAKMTSQKE